MALINTDIRTVKVTYSTLYFGGFITLAATIAYILISRFNQYNVQAKDVIALFTAGLVTTTLIYTAKNLRLNFEANQAKLQFDSDKFEYEKFSKTEEIRRKKIEYSFQICSQWYSPAMALHVELSRSFVRKHADKLKDHIIADFVNELEANLESRRCVISVLNYFENISLLIAKELIDEEIIRDSFKTLFCEYFKVLKPYINERQKQSVRFLTNYEEIAKKWSKI